MLLPDLSEKIAAIWRRVTLAERNTLVNFAAVQLCKQNNCSTMSVPLEVVEAEMRKRHPPKLTIAVAVDGSQMSDRACRVAGSFLNAKRGDKLCILHVSDSSKTFLPRHLQPQHLKNYYQDLAASIQTGLSASWVCREKGEGQSTCEALTAMAQGQGVDLMVAGSFGRKGEKLDLLGSVADFSLRAANASMCIVRSTGNKFDRQCKFVFSTDGSHAAALAFLMLVNKIVRPMDIVHVVMISTTDGLSEQQFVEQYKEYLATHKVQGTAGVKCIDRTTMTVPDGILEAARELDADVLVQGISGYGKKKLGSVSEDISVRAHCTTLVIKDSYEVLSDRFQRAGASTLAQELLPAAPRE